MDGMRREHESSVTFTSPNYGIETTPAEEWRVVHDTDRKAERLYNGSQRRIPDWRAISAEEKAPGRAGLMDAEIIAIILYTGPMASLLPPPLPGHLLRLLQTQIPCSGRG